MSQVPHHIAIVMDGNGRWASLRYLPRVAGHRQGVDSLRRCVTACAQRGVAVLTVFAFSSENWRRPDEEVSGLMSLFAMALAKEVPRLKAEGVQLHFVGERRLSNFLLWQAAYSEFYFSDKLWPDFDEAALDLAIDAFVQRERRFGKTPEQLLAQASSSTVA